MSTLYWTTKVNEKRMVHGFIGTDGMEIYLLLVERKTAMISIRRQEIIVKLYFLTHQIWINNVSAPSRSVVLCMLMFRVSTLHRLHEDRTSFGIGSYAVFMRRLHQTNCHRVHF